MAFDDNCCGGSSGIGSTGPDSSTAKPIVNLCQKSNRRSLSRIHLKSEESIGRHQWSVGSLISREHDVNANLVVRWGTNFRMGDPRRRQMRRIWRVIADRASMGKGQLSFLLGIRRHASPGGWRGLYLLIEGSDIGSWRSNQLKTRLVDGRTLYLVPRYERLSRWALF